MLSRILSRIGCEKLACTPGIFDSSRSISVITSRLFSPRFHSDSGFRSTSISAMLMSLGSVPSSGRPALKTTLRISGIFFSASCIRPISIDASVTETLGCKGTLSHSAPSLSSGRNSVPSCGATARLATRAAVAPSTTSLRRPNAQFRAGSYMALQRSTSALS